MSNIKVIADKDEIVAIANAVRIKTGDTETMRGLDGIVEAINGINSGYISPLNQLVRVVVSLGEQTSCYINGPIFDENGNLIGSNVYLKNDSTYYFNLTFPYVFEASHEQGDNGSVASFSIISGEGEVYLNVNEVGLIYIWSDATIQVEASPNHDYEL